MKDNNNQDNKKVPNNDQQKNDNYLEMVDDMPNDDIEVPNNDQQENDNYLEMVDDMPNDDIEVLNNNNAESIKIPTKLVQNILTQYTTSKDLHHLRMTNKEMYDLIPDLFVKMVRYQEIINSGQHNDELLKEIMSDKDYYSASGGLLEVFEAALVRYNPQNLSKLFNKIDSNSLAGKKERKAELLIKSIENGALLSRLIYRDNQYDQLIADSIGNGDKITSNPVIKEAISLQRENYIEKFIQKNTDNQLTILINNIRNFAYNNNQQVTNQINTINGAIDNLNDEQLKELKSDT